MKQRINETAMKPIHNTTSEAKVKPSEEAKICDQHNMDEDLHKAK